MPPANTIGLASKYLPVLDEVYKRGSLTSIFDTAENRVNWIGAKTVSLFDFDPVGMANYDRDEGFVTGNITAGWKPYQIEVDRGRSYQIDMMDNEETLGMAVASALSEIERVEVIPEVDAYRFAKWAGTTGVSTGTAATIVPGTTDVAGLIDTAEAQMDNDEVPYEGRILYVSPLAYMALKGNIERRIINSEDNVNTNVEFYDDMRIIRVPQARFQSAITLAAPTTAAGVGGFAPATGAKAINFMIVHPSAIMQVMKHRLVRVFSPEQNIEADAYRLNFRFYHDTFVKANKVKGIYVQTEA
jgi:hypothetical protein